jgi:hypothetical protein
MISITVIYRGVSIRSRHVQRGIYLSYTSITVMYMGVSTHCAVDMYTEASI